MRWGILLAALALVLAPAGRSSSLPLPTRLAQALAVPGNSPAASAAFAVDLASGRAVFARNPDLPLAPASNEKLAVTYTALTELGTGYRFRTEVLARGVQDGSVWHGDLFLKGFGDPTLTGVGLDRLAAQLAELGILRVDGRLLADESWFDALRTAPGWKAAFWKTECPPLSALVVDRGWYDHHVASSPAVAAVGLFRRVLRSHGIATGPVGTGRAPADAPALAQVESAPLATIVSTLDRDSDNFVGEILLKEIGAEVGARGTTAAGAAIVRRDLGAAGIPLAGVRIVDGSGLSVLDRVTARMLAQVLLTVWANPELRPVVWSALATAGVNGTLERRMRTAPARGAVHAKTGTTEEASALSGYVAKRYVFALLQNGRPVAATAARKAQDRFATALASAARGK